MKKGFDAVNLHGCLSGIIATPAIGENGNWFLGNDDSGVSAKGETGPAGPQGEKGDQGEIGPAGPQGIQGIQGEKGDQGIQGEKGDKGDPGEKGEKGDKGEDADSSELERLGNAVDTINQSLNTVNDKFIYSTSEKVIGTWINGKPLYRKSFYGTITKSGYTQVENLDSLNIAAIKFLNGIIRGSNDTVCYPINQRASDADWNRVVFINKNYSPNTYPHDTFLVALGSIFPAVPVSYDITIEYTKTTD